jgi:hypothetical protein
MAQPAFLGICQSALLRGDGVSLDLYGVSDVLALPFFPQSLSGMYLALAMPCEIAVAEKSIRIALQDKERPSNTASVEVAMTLREKIDRNVRLSGSAKLFTELSPSEVGNSPTKTASPRLLPRLGGEPYKLLPVPCPPLFITQPGEIIVGVDTGGRFHKIGAFACVFVQPLPISEEERAAIRSRPGAIGGVTYVISCKKCADGVRICLSLETSAECDSQSIRLDRAPDRWTCKCGETDVPLTYLKQGLHEMLRRVSCVDARPHSSCMPLYEPGAVSAIAGEYQKVLVQHSDDEEMVFDFIANNPILWNFLAPLKIWKKPPILSKYKADFAILTRSNVLYLVEIEKPTTKLVKARGGVSSEFQAGLDQIRDWREEVEKRREAVLAGLNLSQDQVHHVRYILIAGMASHTPPRGVAQVRAMKSDADAVFCFDELASFLHSLATALMRI